jgi:hypothetical protein
VYVIEANANAIVNIIINTLLHYYSVIKINKTNNINKVKAREV